MPTKDMLEKLSERLPYIEMLVDKKKNQVTISLETLYEMVFPQKT